MTKANFLTSTYNLKFLHLVIITA
uniref:Uncharacterized protein n=1 Tax=Rhizophora mucronata TaxID=61149 RepID=A0A2P2NM75_RHIMU